MNRIELIQSINRWSCRAAPFLIVGALAIAALSSCGGGGDEPATTDDFQIDVPTTPSTTAVEPTTTSKDSKKDDFSGSNAYGGGGAGDTIKPVGVVPACSPSTLSPAVKAWGKKEGSKATLATPNYKCADGWAIALANVGPGTNSYSSTLVFVGINGRWAAQNRQEVCKSPSPVPNRLYQLGCNSN